MPERTAPLVERLVAAGAIVMGRTITSEFGWKGVSDSPLTGITPQALRVASPSVAKHSHGGFHPSPDDLAAIKAILREDRRMQALENPH